jgi:hypothetical protein
MARQKRNMAAWVRRRAREHMRNFNTPRAKAVRYAADDWKALQGGVRTCDDLGVCQREAVRVFRGAEQQECNEPGKCIFRKPIPPTTVPMADFRRFLSKSVGPAR